MAVARSAKVSSRDADKDMLGWRGKQDYLSQTAEQMNTDADQHSFFADCLLFPIACCRAALPPLRYQMHFAIDGNEERAARGRNARI